MMTKEMINLVQSMIDNGVKLPSFPIDSEFASIVNPFYRALREVDDEHFDKYFLGDDEN